MTDRHVQTIAVVGAGMAGLTCASRLIAAGFSVRVFEKSRGIGGRIATRRTADGLQFDHGAQYFTATTPAFQDFTSEARRAGNLEGWLPDGRPEKVRGDWLVGQPAMNAFLKPAAERLNVELGTQVSDILPSQGGWALSFHGHRSAEVFDAVIVTAPAPQTQALTTASQLLQKRLDAVEVAPCWALMLAAEVPVMAGPSVFEAPHPDIAWMARNASKPGRERSPETWIVHASTSWSVRHLEAQPEDAATYLRQIAVPLAGLRDDRIVYAAAHRWRYARPLKPAGAPFLSDETGTLLAAGDWCLGARVENAFESGRAAAGFIAGAV